VTHELKLRPMPSPASTCPRQDQQDQSWIENLDDDSTKFAAGKEVGDDEIDRKLPPGSLKGPLVRGTRVP